jgi:hypothetical protein
VISQLKRGSLAFLASNQYSFSLHGYLLWLLFLSF